MGHFAHIIRRQCRERPNLSVVNVHPPASLADHVTKQYGMTRLVFGAVLAATGYLDLDGNPAPGLARAGRHGTARLRTVLEDEQVGLQADAVFSAQGAPTSIFKDAGATAPAADTVRGWYEAAWNYGDRRNNTRLKFEDLCAHCRIFFWH